MARSDRLQTQGQALPIRTSPTRNLLSNTAGNTMPRDSVKGVIATSGSSIEAREKNSMPTAMTRFPPYLSANVPPISCVDT